MSPSILLKQMKKKKSSTKVEAIRNNQMEIIELKMQ